MNMSPAILRTLISYDCATGAIVWRERTPSDFDGGPSRTPESLCKSFNNKHAGKPALVAPSRAGHLCGHVKGIPLLAHRVAWAIHYRSEEHTSELQSLMRISYAVFCLKKTTKQT